MSWSDRALWNSLIISCCLFSTIPMADPASSGVVMDDDIVEKIVSRRLASQDPLLHGVLQVMEDAKYIIRGIKQARESQSFSMQKPVGSVHSQISMETQNMLLSAKLVELSMLQEEVRLRITDIRNRFNELGFNNKSQQWERRAQRIERRFNELSQMILAIRSADSERDRVRSADLALTKLDQLSNVPGNKHEVLPEMKPTLRPEKTQPYQELPIADTFPRYVHDQ